MKINNDQISSQVMNKVALFLPSLRGGGAERVMVTLANGFSARGYRVDMVLAKAEGPYLDDVCGRVGIVDLGTSRILRSLPGLISYLRRERPAAMLSAMAHANVIALTARAMARVYTRIVVSERNNFSISEANASSRRDRAMGFFMRRAYPRADGIVAVSGGVADDLAEGIGIPRSAIDVVYNPVLNDRLYSLSEEGPAHPWLARPGRSPVVLGVGRLTAQKDFSTLIRAFVKVRVSHDVRLLILGEGQQRAELEAMVCQLGIQDEVSLPGFAANPFAIMRRSKLFVLSSGWEGLPNALIQAMACGTPVVSTDCPSGPAEILEDGKWGRLVPVGDTSALADAIVKTLDDDRKPDVARRAADFSVDQAVNAYLNILLPKTKASLSYARKNDSRSLSFDKLD